MRLLSVLMAILTVFSSVGVSVSMHLCGDSIMSIGVWSDAHKCDIDDESLSACTNSNGHLLRQKSCCSDRSFFTKASFELLSRENPESLIANYPQLTFKGNLESQENVASFLIGQSNGHSPPDLITPTTKERLSQLQVFII